jgi:hypothetical protein
MEAVRVAAAADDWVFAIIDPILPIPSEMDVETAAASTAATIPPPQTTHRPAPDSIASFVETTPNAPTSSHRLPKDTIGVRPGDDPERPITSRNGEAKGSTGNSFIDLYPEKPQGGWPNITTASRARTGASQSDAQPGSSSADGPDAKGNAVSHAGLQDPHPGGGAPSESNQGKKDSKSDKAGPGGSATAGGTGHHASKDTSSAGKSAPAGHQDNPKSDRSGPSAEKADQKSKNDADKKDKDKSGKDKDGKGKGPH